MAISKRLRYEVLRRDNYTCRYCGAFAPLVVLEVDHVIPRSRGGRDVLENLVTACEDCNSGKAAAMPEEWLPDEIRRAARQWYGPVNSPERDEDEASRLERIQASVELLAAMTTLEALRWIGLAADAAAPYRLTIDELALAASEMARKATARDEPKVPRLWRGAGWMTDSMITRKPSLS